MPRWENRHWRSFAARTVHDLARDLHMATIYADPTTPPRPQDHPLAEQLSRMIASKEYYRVEGEGRAARRVYDEAKMTADLDRVIESREPLANVERFVADQQDWLDRLPWSCTAAAGTTSGRSRNRPTRQVRHRAQQCRRSRRPSPNSTNAARWPATIRPCCAAWDW